jgi:hypothetical protein
MMNEMQLSRDDDKEAEIRFCAIVWDQEEQLFLIRRLDEARAEIARLSEIACSAGYDRRFAAFEPEKSTVIIGDSPTIVEPIDDPDDLCGLPVRLTEPAPPPFVPNRWGEH